MDAQFSIAYPFAAAAYYPLLGLGPKWQTSEVVENIRVRRLMEKVNVRFHEMERFPLPEYHKVHGRGWLRLLLRRGEEHIPKKVYGQVNGIKTEAHPRWNWLKSLE